MIRPTVLAAALLAAAPAAASDLPWLVGHWLDCDGKAVSETWVDGASDTLVGVGLTRGRARTSFEFMRIARAQDGTLAFNAMPNGAPPTAFPLKSQAPQAVVFENLAHDFPQRVSYRREGDTLHARIEGLMDGRLQGMAWTFKAAAAGAACPAP